MTRRFRPGILTSLVLLAGACAHDGGFGHSRRTIHVRGLRTGLGVEYRVVLNRDEALAEMALMDSNRDGQVGGDEKEKYFNARGKTIAGMLSARTPDGKAVAVEYEGFSLDQALAQTYRFSLQTEAEEVLLEDRVFPHKPGLVQIRHGDGLKVDQARPTNLAHAERVSLSIKRTKP